MGSESFFWAPAARLSLARCDLELACESGVFSFLFQVPLVGRDHARSPAKASIDRECYYYLRSKD